jgi:hypothetical protein
VREPEKEMTDVKAEKLINIYRKMSTRLSELEQEQDTIKAQRKMVADHMLELLKETGAESMRTAAGTIYRTVRPRYTTTDWDSMYKFIVEHDAFHLMQQRVHDTNMKKFLEENPEVLPPGLNCLSAYTVGVRKSR